MVQAIGSEVAAETSSSAEMNVPAMIVAVSRAEANEANIGKTPLHFSGGTDLRTDARYNARSVPIQN
jgi:hypothetical protein